VPVNYLCSKKEERKMTNQIVEIVEMEIEEIEQVIAPGVVLGD
jgi:hypothetical protein